MMHVCNPALRLCSAVHHTPGWLAVGDVAANRKTHTRGIPPPPRGCSLAPSQAAAKRRITQTQREGTRNVEGAEVVQVQELNTPLKNGRCSDQTGYLETKG